MTSQRRYGVQTKSAVLPSKKFDQSRGLSLALREDVANLLADLLAMAVPVEAAARACIEGISLNKVRLG